MDAERTRGGVRQFERGAAGHAYFQVSSRFELGMNSGERVPVVGTGQRECSQAIVFAPNFRLRRFSGRVYRRRAARPCIF